MLAPNQDSLKINSQQHGAALLPPAKPALPITVTLTTTSPSILKSRQLIHVNVLARAEEVLPSCSGKVVNCPGPPRTGDGAADRPRAGVEVNLGDLQ